MTTKKIEMIESIRRYKDLPNRLLLEEDTRFNIEKGFLIIGNKMITPCWMISLVSFLKWHYKTDCASEASALAEKEGVFVMIAEAFKRECAKRL